jgi:chromosome segregation ATPase
MKKEELKKESEECMHNALYWLKLPISKENVEQGGSYILKLLEPREKRIAELEDKLANADYQLEGRDVKIKELEAQIEKMKQALDNAREESNRQEQWEIYSVLNGIYNDNFEVITSVSN